MLRRREARGQRTFRERLEISDARIAPPLRFLLLDLQERRHLRVTLGIDVRSQALPLSAHLTNGIDTPRISMHQLVPQDAARPGSVIPWHVMEPQQELFLHALDIAE